MYADVELPSPIILLLFLFDFLKVNCDLEIECYLCEGRENVLIVVGLSYTCRWKYLRDKFVTVTTFPFQWLIHWLFYWSIDWLIGDFADRQSVTQYSRRVIAVKRNSPEMKQGKSKGFESCDRPIVRKRPIWVKSMMFCNVRPWNLMDDLGKQ